MAGGKRLYSCDLHIHSCLSPCADILMTPGNIIKKAHELKLDIISITDHNSAGNVEVACKMLGDDELIIIPGMEVESSEEIHLLCYFETLEGLQEWEAVVFEALPNRENDEEIFGYQLLIDESDEYCAREERLLAAATNMSVEDIVKKVHQLNGIVIPSHVDRPYNSIIGQLGFIPPELNISVLEISRNTLPEKFFSEYPNLKGYSYIIGSDSHYLDDMQAMIKIGADWLLKITNYLIGR